MSDIKEYAIEHEQQIIEDFIEKYHDAWSQYIEKVAFNQDFPNPDEAKELFSKYHPDYWRFVELHYADYKSEGQ